MIKNIDPKFKIMTSMIVWGSLGLFVRNINLTSIEISFFRAFLGSIFLIVFALISRERLDRKSLKRNILYLLLSGIALGINWAALFQAMKYTTVSIATLSYYFAPIFIVLFSAIILKEKMSLKNLLCIVVSLVGLFMILRFGSKEKAEDYNHILGISFGLFGALLYAIIVILNKFIKDLSPIQITLSQLIISTIVLLPIVLRKGLGDLASLSINSWILLLILGVVHTGLAYLLYFPSLKDVKGQTIALVSYLDPITAIFLSTIILKESMTLVQLLGGGLILFSAYANEK